MNKYLALALSAALLLGLVLAGAALAQTSANYDLSWHVVGSGGRGMGSSTYAMEGTFGQILADEAESDHYALAAGHWDPRPGEQFVVYLPLVLRGQP
jgi:hypothetical protein